MTASLWRLSVCLMSCAALAACNRGAASGRGPAGVRVATLERTSCHGTCPVYAVTLRSDGGIRYEGMRNVRVIGVRSWRAHAESAATVFRFADSAHVGTLASRYDFGDPGCAPFMAELPGFSLTMVSAGSSKRIDANEGCAAIPPALKTLLSMIDRVAGADSLAGKR